MPEFPTIVRQRLRAGEDRKGLHPDADTLTAYVEQLLPSHERDYVIRHLSVCAECRDVLTLTMPEIAAEAPVPEVVALPSASVVPMSTPARRRSWFFTPAFGMAASVAAMALGLVLVLRLDHDRAPVASVQQKPQQQVQARNEDKVAVPEPAAGKAAEPAPSFVPQVAPPSPPPVAIGRNQPNFAEANLNRGAATKAKAPSQEVAGLLPPANQPAKVADLRKDYLNSQIIFANAADMRSAQELPQAPQPVFSSKLAAPTILGGVGGTVQNNANLQIPANNGQNQNALRFYSTPQQPGSSILDKIVDAGKLPLRAKKLAPAIRARETERLSMFSPGLSLADSSQAGPVARAPETAEAKSELAQSQAFTRRALAPASGARLDEPVIQWKVAQGKLLKSADLSSWTEAYPASEGIQFTVVSGSGPDIWAGGSKAALVHSRDAGASWDKVRLGVAANGDIMAIEGGGLTLQVRTSTGQTWATTDGGASWTQR